MARLCCRKRVNESISVSAQLTKPLYFTDETIQLNITIDNSDSKRTIDEIEVTLRQIVSVNTDGKNQYKHGSMNYDPATTKVYDIRKLDFGNLENGLFTNTFKASFNLKNVVSTLFELRSKLKDKKISATE